MLLLGTAQSVFTALLGRRNALNASVIGSFITYSRWQRSVTHQHLCATASGSAYAHSTMALAEAKLQFLLCRFDGQRALPMVAATCQLTSCVGQAVLMLEPYGVAPMTLVKCSKQHALHVNHWVSCRPASYRGEAACTICLSTCWPNSSSSTVALCNISVKQVTLTA
eukprot:GHRR01013403.1.p1 GENE.GHRR01013403.1~~GHRR01013403.1.p1  ORF type:complete len:167 (+),score=27.09 GHRR01013403.1:1662-2162(+)